MVRVLRDRYLWFLVALVVITGAFSNATIITTLIGLAPSESWELASYAALYRFLFLFSTAIAAWRFGLKGGLVACFISGQIILSPFFTSPWRPDAWLEIGVIILGVAISWLISGYERRRKLLQRTAVELGQQTKELIQEITERQQAEELFRGLALSSPIGVFIIQDRKFVYSNPQFRKDSGYGEEELFRTDSLKIVLPEDRDAVRENAISMLKGERTTAYEYRVTTKSGDIRWALETVAPIQYQGRRATLGNFVDITERKQAEEALQESEKKYSTLVEQGNDGIIIIQDGLVKFANSKMIEITGFSLKEALDKSFTDFFFSEDNELVVNRFKKKISAEVIPSRYETGIRSKDGRRIPIEISASAIEYKGKPADMAVIRDITVRKQAEGELKLRAQILDSATDSIFLHDFDGNFIYVNETACRVHGYSREEFMSMKLWQLVTPENIGKLNTSFREIIEKGGGIFDSTHVCKDGSIMPVEVHGRTIESGGGKLILAVIRDVTERKKMQEQLIVSDRLASVGELASGIAHELNNPLTGVIGFSQLLMEKDVADDIKDDVKVIYREAQRTADVVKNLLAFARKHTPKKEVVNINSIVDKVLELRAYDQRINNIKVITQFSPDLPEVIADYFQIQQVFLNIVINAEHFMIEAHGKGKLTITTEKVGDIIQASFADDGPGIPPKNLGHLFDPFFTTKEVGKGTGLGLSICHGIIIEHGGRIYAESKFGEGAIFIVELPMGYP